MPTASWTPFAAFASIGGNAMNNLGIGAVSPVMSFDNTGNYLYAHLSLELGSISPVSGGFVTLRAIGHNQEGNWEDIVPAGSGHQESKTATLLTGAGIKRVVFPRFGLSPGLNGFVLLNGTGVLLALTGNSLKLRAHGEASN